jgi:hypothetical protein
MPDLDALFASQKVRAFDTYALGPFMVWYASKSKGMEAWPRRALFVAGIYTTIYNWKKYREAQAFLTAKAQELLTNQSLNGRCT